MPAASLRQTARLTASLHHCVMRASFLPCRLRIWRRKAASGTVAVPERKSSPFGKLFVDIPKRTVYLLP